MKKKNIVDYEDRYALFDAINHAHFSGRLTRPEISIEMMDTDRYGCAVGRYKPCDDSSPAVIIIPSNVERVDNICRSTGWTRKEAYAQIMAHEMLHHYCAIHGIRDWDCVPGCHTLDFAVAALSVGLIDPNWITACCTETRGMITLRDDIFWPDPCNDCVYPPDIDYDIFADL